MMNERVTELSTIRIHDCSRRRREEHGGIGIHDEYWQGDGKEAGFRWDWLGGGTDPFRRGTGLPEIKGKVSECLSGAFVCFGRSGLQCGVQQPS